MERLTDWYAFKAKMNLQKAANERSGRTKRAALPFGSPDFVLLAVADDYRLLQSAHKLCLSGKLPPEEFDFKKQMFLNSLRNRIKKFGFTAEQLQAKGVKVNFA